MIDVVVNFVKNKLIKIEVEFETEKVVLDMIQPALLK